jgi:Uma2 family endonuclease
MEKNMSVQAKQLISVEEYLAMEREIEEKHGYLNGEVFAMGGASPNHGLIVTNVVIELGTQLKKRPCTVYAADLRVKVTPTGLYTYPDVVVVCGEPQFDDQNKDTLTNPTLIVEVLSESTKSYDRGDKFAHYRSLPSFMEYVLIDQDAIHVEHFIRQPDNRWILAETNRIEDTIELGSIGCTLSLMEVYDKVRL